MGSILGLKATGSKRASLLRVSWSFIKGFSTGSLNPSSGGVPVKAPAAVGQKSKRKKKKKNLFEIAEFLPNWGIGYHMAKTHWQSVSYHITKINLYKDGKHGKAWGIAHKDGSPIADAAKKISGVHKRCWRYLPNSKKIQESSTPKPEALAT